MYQDIIRLHWLIFAVTLGFASVVEWAHMRQFQARKDWWRVAATATAAIASGYMASEALTHDWPSWENGSASPKAVDWEGVLAEVQS